MRRQVPFDDRLHKIRMAVRRTDADMRSVRVHAYERGHLRRHLAACIREADAVVGEAEVGHLDVLDLHRLAAIAISGSNSRSSGNTGRAIRLNGSSRMSVGVGPGRSSTKNAFI